MGLFESFPKIQCSGFDSYSVLQSHTLYQHPPKSIPEATGRGLSVFLPILREKLYEGEGIYKRQYLSARKPISFSTPNS